MRLIDADALIEFCAERWIPLNIDAVNMQPTIQPEPHWIPCSERLPDIKESAYWVCLDSGNQCQCRWTNNRYGFGANRWSEWGWHVMDKPQYEQIVAWMPLPESYQGGKKK